MGPTLMPSPTDPRHAPASQCYLPRFPAPTCTVAHMAWPLESTAVGRRLPGSSCRPTVYAHPGSSSKVEPLQAGAGVAGATANEWEAAEVQAGVAGATAEPAFPSMGA